MIDHRTPPLSPPPPPDKPSTRRLWMALGVLVLISLAAGTFVLLDGDDAPTAEVPLDASDPTVPATAVALDPEAATKAEILAAYRQSFEAFVAIGSDPNGQPDDPRLKEHLVGDALLASQLSIRKLRDDGNVYRGTVEVHPEVVELNAETAVVSDCNVDVTAVIDSGTGEVLIPAGPGEPGLATATYKLIDGEWMQDGFTDEERSCELPAS